MRNPTSETYQSLAIWWHEDKSIWEYKVKVLSRQPWGMSVNDYKVKNRLQCYKWKVTVL